MRGGIGQLAWGLVDAVRQAGGSVLMANPISNLTPSNGAWRVATRQGELEARAVVANVLPQNLRDLTAGEPGELEVADELAKDVESGWGASMLYRVVRCPPGAGQGLTTSSSYGTRPPHSSRATVCSVLSVEHATAMGKPMIIGR